MIQWPAYTVGHTPFKNDFQNVQSKSNVPSIWKPIKDYLKIVPRLVLGFLLQGAYNNQIPAITGLYNIFTHIIWTIYLLGTVINEPFLTNINRVIISRCKSQIQNQPNPEIPYKDRLGKNLVTYCLLNLFFTISASAAGVNWWKVSLGSPKKSPLRGT